MSKGPTQYVSAPPPHLGNSAQHPVRAALPKRRPQSPPPPILPVPKSGRIGGRLGSRKNTKQTRPKASSKPSIPSLMTSVGFDTDKTAVTIDKDRAKRMRLLALAFLIFYVLIVATKLFADYRSAQNTEISKHLTYSEAVASNIATDIEHAIIWVNNGLSEGQTPAQSARLIAKSPVIKAAAILNEKGEIVANYPRRSPILNDLPTVRANTDAIEINSVIQQDGSIYPLILKKTGIYYVAAAMNDNILVDSNQVSIETKAIVAKSGRIIDGTSTSGALGSHQMFNLSDATFARLTTSGTNTTQKITIGGRKHLLASVPIENTDLFLLEAKPIKKISVLQNNLMLFTLLFLGTCVLIFTLLNSLKAQLRSVQDVQQTTEVSQQRYQAAIEGDRGGVWEVDLASGNAFISASLAGLLGLSRTEQTMSLSKFMGLFHTEDRDRFLAFARRAHMQGEFDFDIRVRHLPLVLQCRGRSSTRSGSEMKRVIVGVALDITEQRAAQTRLKTTEARLHNALSSMTDSFVVWDANNRLVVWNNRFEEFFNIAPGSLQQGMEHASVDYLARPSIYQQYQRESMGEFWVEYQLGNGRWIRYIETATSEGGHVSIGTDITELRLRETELQNNENALTNTVDVLRKSQISIVELAERYESEKIRAEEASQSKSNFLASMSHELRTPLNAINGFSDIMQKEMFGPLGDPRYKEYVNDILFSGQHLLSLINDILDMSKIEAGKMTLNAEIMFMHEMVEQVVRMIRGRADDAGLKLDVDVKEMREIEADPRSVKQVLLNLLTNAVKFTPEGGTVGVELIQKATGIIVKVNDSGIGISQENIEKLAKPFEQVDNEASRQTEGTGLGLALSKSLVELHGGNFKIESVVGQGTTVIFSLPNKPVQQSKSTEIADVSNAVTKITADIATILGQDEQNGHGSSGGIIGEPAQTTTQSPTQAPTQLPYPDEQTAPQQPNTVGTPQQTTAYPAA